MSSVSGVTRVVIRPPNWLGDAVLALPAISTVRRAFPDAHLAIAAVPAVAALFRERTPAAPDQVVDLAGSSSAAIAQLREGRYDLGVLFPNSFRSAWQLRQAGVAERWGYRRSWRGWLLTRSARPPKGRQHQVDYYRALVRQLGLAGGDEPPSLTPSADSFERADRLLRRHGLGLDVPRIVWAPGAAYGQAKQWPSARVGAVLAAVLARHRVGVVLVGAPHHRDAARAIESWLRAHAADVAPRVLNLVGHTTVGELAGIAARASVFATNDSGAMHVAAALGRPVVALFGPTDERVTGPLGGGQALTASAFCRPCLLRDCPIDHRCMKRISIDQVVSAIATRLEAAG